MDLLARQAMAALSVVQAGGRLSILGVMELSSTGKSFYSGQYRIPDNEAYDLAYLAVELAAEGGEVRLMAPGEAE